MTSSVTLLSPTQSGHSSNSSDDPKRKPSIQIWELERDSEYKKQKGDSISREDRLQIFEILRKAGYRIHMSLNGKDDNNVVKISNKKNQIFVLKMTPLAYRGIDCAKIASDRGEALIRSLPPDRTINRIVHRLFYSPGALGVEELKTERDNSSKYVLDFSPFIDGTEIFELLVKRQCGFPIDKAIQYAIEVGEAIGFLHDKGVAYRDLKPENLLLDSEGTIKIVDNEFAKRIVPHEPMSPVGTPHYRAPEITKNRDVKDTDLLLDRTDAFSFGVTLYTFITGFPPYDDEHRIAFHETGKPTPFMTSACIEDPVLLKIILGLMDINPENRMTVTEATKMLKARQEKLLQPVQVNPA